MKVTRPVVCTTRSRYVVMWGAYFEHLYIDYQLANIPSTGTGMIKARGLGSLFKQTYLQSHIIYKFYFNSYIYIYIYITHIYIHIYIYIYIFIFIYIYIHTYIIREIYIYRYIYIYIYNTRGIYIYIYTYIIREVYIYIYIYIYIWSYIIIRGGYDNT